MHLANGALSYLTAPLWLALPCIGVLLHVRRDLGVAKTAWLFDTSSSAAGDLAAAGWIWAASAAFLLAPKFMAYAMMLADPALRKGCGGGWAALRSVVMEVVISSLIAPVIMLSQTKMVVDLLSGRAFGWNPQRRSDRRVGVGEILHAHLWHTLVGLGLGAAALYASPAALMWVSPIVLGLVLSAPMARILADCDLGSRAGQAALLQVRNESSPPSIWLRANALADDYGAAAARKKGVEPFISPDRRTGFEFGTVRDLVRSAERPPALGPEPSTAPTLS